MIGLFGAILSISSIPFFSFQVEGEGYFCVKKDHKKFLHKRIDLCVNNGVISHQEGGRVVPKILAPNSPDILDVDSSGNVFGIYGEDKKHLGRIQIARLKQLDAESKENRFAGSFVDYAMGWPNLQGAGKIQSVSGVLKDVLDEEPKKSREIISLVLKKNASIPRSDCRLSDVLEQSCLNGVEKKLLDICISKRISPGHSKLITASSLQKKLSIIGGNNNIRFLGAKQVRVTRDSYEIPWEQLLAMGLEVLKKTYSTDNVSLQHGNQTAPVIVPSKTWKMLVHHVRRSKNKYYVHIDIYVNHKKFKTRTLSFVQKKEIPDVKKNKQVKVRGILGGVILEMSGKCKSDGFVGKEIDVEIKKGHIVHGVLNKENIVEVRI